MINFRSFLIGLSLVNNFYNPFISASEVINNSSSADCSASVVFVFDTTGSMSNDVVEARKAANTILQSIIQNPAKLICNYILVTFRDPEINLVVDTKDHAVFKKKLDEIEVDAGGDCPEMSIGAIKLALERSRPKSFIYVFTDATAKDHHLVNDALVLIQEKLSEVVFVMTGDCGSADSEGYTVYKKIAFTSSGEVYRVEKHDVEKVLDLLKSSVLEKSQKVNLLTFTDKDESRGKRRKGNLTLPIDKSLSDFTISASGEKIKLDIVDPHGIPADKSKLSEVVNLENVKVVKINNPDPGLWTLFIESDSQYSVRSSGISDSDFGYGFSAQPTTNKEDISLRPVKDTLTILQIWLTEPKSSKNLTSVDLIGNKEKILNSLSLEPVKAEEALYRTKSFMPPDEFFYITVHGVSKDGHPFKRISHSAITSVKPDIAEVEIATPVVKAEALQPSNISCKVKSLLPFDVQWMKNGQNFGALKHYLQSSDVTLDFPKVLTAHEGVYVCKVNNSAGITQKEIKLSVKAAKPVIESGPSKILAVSGQWVKLECNVTADPKASITWHFEDKELPGNQITSNGSLSIPNATKNNEGNYTCTAQNPGGSAKKITSLAVIVPPTITGKENETIQVIEGSDTRLDCNVNGLPSPVISWKKIGSDINDLKLTKHYSVDATGLAIKNITTDFNGQYTCTAENSGGVAEKIYNLTVLVKPWILDGFKSVVNLTVRDDYMLPCQAKGDPEPSVLWYKANKKVSEDYNLVLRSVTMDEGGLYTCIAKNIAGSYSRNFTMNITDDSPTSSMNSVQILETTDGNLTCPVPLADKLISSIKWLKDGLDLNLTSGKKNHYNYFNEGKIVRITEAELSDNGIFTCIAQTATGKREYNFTVNIITPPYFIPRRVDTDFDIIEGKSVTFNCVVGGNPHPKIKWRHIVESTNIPITADVPGISMGNKNRNLIINSAKKNHTGTYVCIASNSFDILERVFKLTVSGLPEIEGDANENVELILGESYNLICKIKGIPPPEYSWIFTNKRRNRIQSMKHTSVDNINSPFYYDVLRLENVTTYNSGFYSCTAKNKIGSTTKHFNVSVIVKPIIEESNKTEEIVIESTKNLHLTCNITSSSVLKVEWLRNGIVVKRETNEKESENHSYFVDLLPINGNYACRASNKAGIVEKSFNVIVKA